jgi:LacI family transcriptional regulator
MSAVTIKDIAERAQVSIATVSRVIHGQPVSEERKQRVEHWMAQLGYSPNLAARTMRTKSSGMIACAVRGLLMAEMAPFIRAAEAVIRERGYTLLLTSVDEQIEHQGELLRLLSGRGIDGVLLTVATASDELLNKALSEMTAPIVVIDRDVPATADVVSVDHRQGIRAAVEYLVSLGHQRIALMVGSADIRPGRERIIAFERALHEQGIVLNPRMISDQCINTEQCFRHASLLLSSGLNPTAIIAGGMALLPGVLRAVRSRGLEIGTDISVIAGCDSELAQLTTPATTVIRWDLEEWGRTSAQLLCDSIESPLQASGRQVIMPTELVVRGSCGRPRLDQTQ